MTQFVSILCLEILMTAGMTAHAWPCLAQVSREDVHKDFQVVRMTVDPANEPIPAFRYRLFPHGRDQEEGNAVPFYLRAMLELQEIELQVKEEFGEELHKWAVAGHEQVPVEVLRDVVRQFDESVLPHLLIAARRGKADWGIEERSVEGVEEFYYLIPEMRPARALAGMLALRTRLAILESRHDDAIESVKMGYKLSHDASMTPYIFADMYGATIVRDMNRQLEELIAAQNSPSIYWALRAMPDPLVVVEDSIEFEMNMAERIFPWMRDIESAEHTPDEWGRIFSQSLHDLLAMVRKDPDSDSSRAGPTMPNRLLAIRNEGIAIFVALKTYSKSKQALVSSGMPAEKVEAMPVAKVLLLQNARSYRFMTDRLERAWHVPFWQSHELAKEADSFEDLDVFEGGAENRALEPIPIGQALLPAMNSFRVAQELYRRELAALTVIEAIRVHAANAGTLPTSLDEIAAVPVPLNPATGAPFQYELKGNTAILILPIEDALRYGRRYEIRLRE